MRCSNTSPSRRIDLPVDPGIAGAITGSMAAIALGAVLLLLLLVAVIGGLVFYRATRRLAAVESARPTAFQAARDAGFEVEAVDDVATGVESFERDLEPVRTPVTRTEQDHERTTADLAELRAGNSELRDRITDQAETVESGLEESCVETIDAFVERVDRREDLRRRQETARQSLVDRFGDPELESTLEAHDGCLDEFDRRAREVDTRPFIDRAIALDSRSRDGHDVLADDLEAVVRRIETDA